MTRNLTISLFSLLGAVLILSACDRHGPKPHLDAKLAASFDQVAQVVARRDDRVSVDELARWIIQGRKNYVLIDARSPNDYVAGHIEGALNLSVPELVSQKQDLPRDRKLIVYTQGSEIAAQAVVLLRLAGYDADLLLGGYNFWNQHVLNPAVHPTLADDEFLSLPEKQARACYFVGGKAVPAPAKATSPAFVPPLAKPAAPLPPISHEGC